MSDCPECDYEHRTGQAAPVTHTCLKREMQEHLRVSYDAGETGPSMKRPPVILIEGTPPALRFVSHLISEALSMTQEGNTVTATHPTGAKITIRRL